MTNKACSPITVLDPYEWLPSDGEDRVRFWSDGLDIVVEVSYEVETEASVRKANRTIRFHDVSAFYRSLFPAAESILDVSYSKENFELGSLVEFRESDIAKKWTLHFQSRFLYRHYLIFFLSAGYAIEVIACSFSVTPEQGVSG